MRSFKDSNFLFRQLEATWENAAVMAPIIVGLSLFIGIIFYSIANGWDFAVSYFFAATVLFGDMYLVPTEPNPWSHVFTLFYFLWGTTLLAGAITSAANMVVNSAVRIAAEERKRFFATTTGIGIESLYRDEPVVAGYLAHIFRYFQWAKYRSKYIALFFATVWISIGTCYAMLYEKWPLVESILFAIAAVSTAGSVPPPCNGPDVVHCDVGTFRALFIGTYIVIGVPIFAYTVGQFAEILVERAIKANEMKLMARPLTPQEFRFAFELHRGEIIFDSEGSGDENAHHDGGAASDNDKETSSVINDQVVSDNHNLGDLPSLSMRNAFQRQKSWRGYSRPHSIRLTLEDFIILEMLRLQKITADDLQYIKMLFDSLDEDGDGVILSPDEGIQLARDISRRDSSSDSQYRHQGSLLPNTAQKLSPSSSIQSRANTLSATSTYLHPTMSTYGSLYAIPEGTTMSGREGKNVSDASSDGEKSVDSNVHSDAEDTATVVDDEETLEALKYMSPSSRKMTVTEMDVSPAEDERIPNRKTSRSRTSSSSRKSSRADSHPYPLTHNRHGTTSSSSSDVHDVNGMSRTSSRNNRSSRSSSRVDSAEFTENRSHTTAIENNGFTSPIIQPVFDRRTVNYFQAPSVSDRWQRRVNSRDGLEEDMDESLMENKVYVDDCADDDDAPFLQNRDAKKKEGDTTAGDSADLADISSQYNRLILSRLNPLYRQASVPPSTPTPSSLSASTTSKLHAEQSIRDGNLITTAAAAEDDDDSLHRSSKTLWSSVLSTVGGFVRAKRAVSESGVPPQVQLPPFQTLQSSRNRRVSISGGEPIITSSKFNATKDWETTV